MPTSINGAASALGSGQSGPSASSSSPMNNNPFLAKWRKVEMADFLRLMKDNQRVLDNSLGNVQTLNQQTAQLRAGQVQATGLAADKTPAPASPTAAESETDMAGMGDIKIDSPETHNHYYALETPPQAAPPAATTAAPVPAAVPTTPPAANPVPAKSWLPTVLAVLGSAAAAGLIGYLLHQSPAPITPAPTINVPAPTNTSLFSGFGLDLEQALEATGTAP